MRCSLRVGMSLFVAFVAACGADTVPTFDPHPHVGTWVGRWRADNGRVGGLRMTVVDNGGELEFSCDLMGGGLPGLTPPVERFVATVEPHRARIDSQSSRTFGQVSGSLDADGYLVLDCEGVLGPAKNLHAEGTWTDSAISLDVDLSYDGSLRKNTATVAMKRK